MKNRELICLFGIVLFIVLAASVSAKGSFITGRAITSHIVDNASLGELNELQKIYQEAAPAVVKILVYADYSYYMPKITKIDLSEYYWKLNRGLTTDFINDVKISYDENQNMYDYWGEIYGYNSTVRNDGLWYGSGFLISPDGYVLTNAHVAVLNEKFEEETWRNNTLIYNINMIDEAYATGGYASEEEYLNDLAIYNFMFDHLKVDLSNIKVKVIVGVNNSEKSTIAKEYIPQIKDYERGDMIYTEAGLDWALLKIDGNNRPYLKLGDSDTISAGSNIIILGYPGVSEEAVITPENAETTDYSFRTDVEPTITKGYVSYIRPIGGGYKSLQVDASLSPGNSGGPVLDGDGKVIGLATYGYGAYVGGNYNYVLRINDIKSKISNQVDLAKLSTLKKASISSGNKKSFNMAWVIVIVLAVIVVVLIGIILSRNLSKHSFERPKQRR